MHLSPKEIEKLMLHNAGFLAQKRLARGIRLNYVESVALLSAQLLEFIREGDSVITLMDKGKQLLGLTNVMDGVAGMLLEVQVEGTFADGTKLVTVHNPICKESGDMELALYGSGLIYTDTSIKNPVTTHGKPGEYFLQSEDIKINSNRNHVTLKVLNKGDRPVQVGSHYPFFEVNPMLAFDREKAFRMRLDIPAGTAVRFEPGESKMVDLVELGGTKTVYGANALINGSTDESRLKECLEKAKNLNFQIK